MIKQKWLSRINPYGDYSYECIDEEFNFEDGQPKKCIYCGCKKSNSEVKGKINYAVCEEEHYCLNCRKIIGYWAYGCWEPSYIIKKFTYGRLFKDIWTRVVFETEAILRKFRIQKNWKRTKTSSR